MALFLLIYDVIIAFTLVFISCELCQRLSNAFSDFDDIIIQYKWYLFPIELKQMLPMVMIVAQKPVLIECFGDIACCRDVFKKVRATTCGE